MLAHSVTLRGAQQPASAPLQDPHSSAVCYAAAHPALTSTTHPNSMCILRKFRINGSGDCHYDGGDDDCDNDGNFDNYDD
jgi:hypothetical protein